MKRICLSIIAVALVVLLLPVGGQGRSVARPRISAGKVHATFVPTKGKLFVLVIGNDARSGNPDRSRADAIHIVGLDTKTLRGGILNFPRDTWVSIPGHGSGKINEALFDGGPELLARTLENLTGIHIDLWVMTGFEGFRGIIRGIGDIKLHLGRDIFDHGSGARLHAGNNTLNPGQALAFVRSRKALPHGDIDRSTNQGRFLLVLLRELRDDVKRDPSRLLRWISLGRRHTRLQVRPEELFELAVLASQVRPSRMGNRTVPVSIGSVGSASVVFLSSGAARPIFARFRRTARL